ncbi:MAG: VacJ family lipoprotein [Alphaproteobacteria bacterium]|nr:VacJ family lipoprotein [Alphaproteobacteria bacterium]
MKYFMHRSFWISVLTVCSALGLAACAASQEAGIPDPLEGTNRVVLDVNEAVDKAVIGPIAQGYRDYTPSGPRIALRNFLRNLNSPIVIGNEILQGDLDGVGNASARAVINTLAGFGGVLDLAEDGGIEHQPEDFGQTLATWGVGDGAYLVLPILGPSSLRDATGNMIDSFADPIRLYLFNVDRAPLHYTRVGLNALSTREELIDVIDDLRRNSFDYYTAIKSSYYQHRQALINDQEDGLAVTDIPDYDDF